MSVQNSSANASSRAVPCAVNGTCKSFMFGPVVQQEDWTRSRGECPLGAMCHDYNEVHRSHYGHRPELMTGAPNANTSSSAEPCAVNGACTSFLFGHVVQQEDWTRSRGECPFGARCHNYSDVHRSHYSHP